MTGQRQGSVDTIGQRRSSVDATSTSSRRTSVSSNSEKDPSLFAPRRMSTSSTTHSVGSSSIASHFQQNTLIKQYTLQNAESGLAADYIKRKNVVRVRSEGEQFLLQTESAREVVDWIEVSFCDDATDNRHFKQRRMSRWTSTTGPCPRSSPYLDDVDDESPTLQQQEPLRPQPLPQTRLIRRRAMQRRWRRWNGQTVNERACWQRIKRLKHDDVKQLTQLKHDNACITSS